MVEVNEEVLLRSASSDKVARLIDRCERENVGRDVIGGGEQPVVDPDVLVVLRELERDRRDVVGRERVRVGRELDDSSAAADGRAVGRLECSVLLLVKEDSHGDVRVVRLVVVH